MKAMEKQRDSKGGKVTVEEERKEGNEKERR